MTDLLAIMAHPDDAELLCGGALAGIAAAGGRAAILDLTRGESGSFGTPGVRSQEAARAAGVLGVAERHNAGFPDGALENTPEARARLAGFIRSLRPRLVVTHWPDARHPDHRAASDLTRDACFLAGVRNAPVEGEPFRPSKLLYALAYAEHAPKPTFVLDITSVMQRKLDAIQTFASQVDGKTALGDVFPAGDRPITQQILALHAHYGSWIRAAYGEPYWTKETMRVDDLLGLDVSSF
jgi:N-acetylglucosamine malate deacetylase 1